MTKKDYFRFLLMLAFAITGFIIHGYIGGLITGISASLIILIYFGKKSANKAAERLEKYIRDHNLYHN